MTVRIADGRAQFRPGEIIPIELEFDSRIPKRFGVDDATYDRGGRRTIDEFLIEPNDAVTDPLLDYFASSGGFIGGGVRLALGAQTRDILTLVAGKGIALTLIGVGIGAVAAVAATRLVSSLLYGVAGFDPTALVLASLLLVLLAVVASYVPARRATKLDPVVALRYR